MQRPWIALTGGEETIGYAERLAIPRSYFVAVEKAGGMPFAPGLEGDYTQEVLNRADGLLLTGGGDVDPALYGQEKHPATGDISRDRDRCEIALARAFYEAGKPIFAICRGIQVLAVALGGTLYQHVPDLPGVTANHGDKTVPHSSRLMPGSRLSAIFGAQNISVNTSHHQAVDRPPEGFAVTAFSDDGLIEGIEGGSALCVQWHPERMLDKGHLILFEDFIRRCR